MEKNPSESCYYGSSTNLRIYQVFFLNSSKFKVAPKALGILDYSHKLLFIVNYALFIYQSGKHFCLEKMGIKDTFLYKTHSFLRCQGIATKKSYFMHNKNLIKFFEFNNRKIMAIYKNKIYHYFLWYKKIIRCWQLLLKDMFNMTCQYHLKDFCF